MATRVWAPAFSIGLPTLAIAAVTLLAAALRFHSLDGVPPNPFYDAAVRSMSLSWHNFLFAAFEPGGKIAVDKPPVDLWLQVASVKLLGWNAIALKLPEAIAGTAAVPLLYDLVRRVFGRGAGLASALALAVLPVTVLTSRSDTMDTVMMLCLIAAGWLVVRGAQTGRARFLYLAAAVMGVAFNVKLVEALLPVPALVLLYVLASPDRGWVRVRHMLVAGIVFLAISLSWVVAVSATPTSSKPYPLGSTNGSVWNSVFVFDGIDRLGLTNRQPGPSSVPAGPSATRLVQRDPAPLGLWVGSELVPALVLGGLALALGALALRRRAPDARLRVALAASLGLWLILGVLGFSHAASLHVRYIEALSPAIAAALGIGVAAAVRRSREQLGVRALLAIAVAGVGAYGVYLANGKPGLEAIVVAGAGVALVVLALQSMPLGFRVRGRALPGVLAAGLLVAALTVPAWASVDIVRQHQTAAALGNRLTPADAAILDRYLTSHQGRARYEVAALNVWQASPLITASARPVMVLRNVNFSPLVSRVRLRQAARSGEVRFVLLGVQCRDPVDSPHFKSRCSAAVRWARTHGQPVLVKGRDLGLYRVRG